MAKKSNGTLFNIGKWAIVIVFSVGAVYTAIQYRLDAVEGKVKGIETNTLPDIEDEIDFHDDRLYETEREVFGIKKDISSLAESTKKDITSLTDKVDRNFIDQQEFQVEQRIMQKTIIDEIKGLHK